MKHDRTLHPKVCGRATRRRDVALVVRDAEWVLAFRDGKTLQQIGDQYGVTRELVRQRLAKLGLTHLDGGYSIAQFKASQDRADALRRAQAARERRCVLKNGCSLELWATVPRKARYAYGNQRQKAKQRGIAWELTPWQWWCFWRDSGKWEERGRGKGYCMARWGDTGPYSPDNIYACTIGENFSHSYLSGRRQQVAAQ